MGVLELQMEFKISACVYNASYREHFLTRNMEIYTLGHEFHVGANLSHLQCLQQHILINMLLFWIKMH